MRGSDWTQTNLGFLAVGLPKRVANLCQKLANGIDCAVGLVLITLHCMRGCAYVYTYTYIYRDKQTDRQTDGQIDA